MGEALISAMQSSPSAVALPNYNPDDPSAGVSFREVLSAVNPLQYLPVVGTIYRAATGDLIPEPLRNMGSLVASGLMGGPIGLAGNLAGQALQKITGIDMDRLGASVLHGMGIGHDDPPPTAVAAAPAAALPETAPAPGQVSDADPDHAADRLNAVQLADITRALSAYGKAA